MNSTPRTDAQILRYRASTLCPSEEARFEGAQVVTADFARDLERENAELRAELAEAKSANTAMNEAYVRLGNAHRRTLEWAEQDNAELRKDKARLDWLADTKNTTGNVTLPREHIMDHPDSMRAAIDAAMEGDK
jgi:cell division septum initiation protein DivIVA